MKNLFASLFKWAKRELKTTKLLFRSIPSIVVAFFVISVITMNLLANKTLIQYSWIAIDAGILVSWISFLSMDIVVKHFGPKAATRMSIVAILVNLVICLIFFLASVINTKTSWAPDGFNDIFKGTWYILLSSTIAFFVSAIFNNIINFFLGKIFKKNPDGIFAFIIRSYVSTFIGQFIDNLIFAVLFFMLFSSIYGLNTWTLPQCLMCSLVGASLELIFEAVFSPLGYLVIKHWKKENVGKEYFDFLSRKEGDEVYENLN